MLNGYQTENERLYTELKQLKEAIKQQHQQNDMETQKLKIELINKNIQIDNLKQQLLQPKLIEAPVKGLSDDSVLQDRIKKLENEKLSLMANLESVKQKLDKFELTQLAMQMNSNQIIESQKGEIKKLEENIKQLEQKAKQSQQQSSIKPSENYKNIKKLKDEYEAKLISLQSENSALKMNLDEVSKSI